MGTPTQELVEIIKSADNIRSLNVWIKKNKKRLLEQERDLLNDVAIRAQQEYINAGECYPPQFVVDRANNVVNEFIL